MATDNTPLPEPIGPVAHAVAARITAKRDELATAEANERDLIAHRKEILADADDATIDDVENKIGASRSRQLRLIEQLDVLGDQLRKANADAQSAALDALAARADRARGLGERLIRDYAKLGTTMAALFRKMAAADAMIEQANAELTRAGRAPIAMPNDIRCRPTQYVEWTVRRTVGAGEIEHPQHAEARWSPNLPAGKNWVDARGNIIKPVELDIDRRELFIGSTPDPVYRSVTLPSATPEPLPHPAKPRVEHEAIWDAEHTEPTPEDIAAIEGEISAPTKERAK